MARRRGGWERLGGPRRSRYRTAKGAPIEDERLERIHSLRIPPAWQDVWISPNARSNLQATGVDAAGRRQYLYHPVYRADQERQKFDGLVRFGELLPDLRRTLAGGIASQPLSREWTCSVAVTLLARGAARSRQPSRLRSTERRLRRRRPSACLRP